MNLQPKVVTFNKIDKNIEKNSKMDAQQSSSTTIEPQSKRRKLTDTKCEVCDTHTSRYTCPGCRIVYCSVTCCTKHKTDTQCTGKRDKTKFVELENFSEMNMQNDYHFLEEVKLKKYSANRTRYTSHIDAHEFQYHPPHVKFLQQRAGQRGIVLSVMPEGMEKRKSNTTRYMNRENKINWLVKLIFDQVQMDDGKTFFVTQGGVSEDTTIFSLIRKALDKNVEGSDPIIRQKLEKYVAWYEHAIQLKPELLNIPQKISTEPTATPAKEQTTSDQPATTTTTTSETPQIPPITLDTPEQIPFHCYLKCEELPSNVKGYYRFDIQQSLNDNLKGKVIVEYPEIHVVLPSYSDEYKEVSLEQSQEIKQLRDEKAELRKKKKEEFEKKREEYEKRQAEYEERKRQQQQQ
jgi:hypothetical protein